MKKYWVMSCSFLLMASLTWAMKAPPRVNLDVQVVNERGETIEGAQVQVSYPGRISGQGESFKRLSDEEGRASFSGSSFFKLRVKAEKAGYYDSSQEVTTFERMDRENVYSDRAVTLALREVKNPVPMYAYRLDTQLQDTAKPKGFDLFKNDWVAPWGTGETADVLFSITGFYNDKFNYDSTLLLEFPNNGDGIAAFQANGQSHFKSPYKAYEEGYTPSKQWRKSRRPKPDNPKRHTITDDTKHDANYIIRIRTVLDENGEVVSALYGKIYGDFSFGGATEEASYLKSGFLYLNPTPNDRNLEYDPKQNLMKGIEPWNEPDAP